VAEIRKHNPTTSDIGEQVRALMGDNVRPIMPGQQHHLGDDMYDPFFDELDDDETETNDVIPLTAGGSPLIGVLPVDFTSWVDDDDDPAA